MRSDPCSLGRAGTPGHCPPRRPVRRRRFSADPPPFFLRGARWVSQLALGFPATGILSQQGVSPASEKANPPISIPSMWKSAGQRFRERSKASGFRNATSLLDEAIAHVTEGWLGGPRDISDSGGIDIFDKGGGGPDNIAFRFGVCQFGKLRARDDLRHNMANLATSILTPITLPSWGHIAQLSKDVRGTDFHWIF